MPQRVTQSLRGAYTAGDVHREYARRWSPALGREMELLRFGHAGTPVVAFPTSMGRFYQWEDFGLVGALQGELEAGRLRLCCLDSVDGESWYAQDRPAPERVRRHLEDERYVLDEVRPEGPGPPVLTGPWFGAFRVVLLCVRHPARFRARLPLSGASSNRLCLDGYHAEHTSFTHPRAFLPGPTDDRSLAPLRAMAPLVVAPGEEDANVGDSRRLAEELRAKG